MRQNRWPRAPVEFSSCSPRKPSERGAMKPSEFKRHAGGVPFSPSGRAAFRMETHRYIGHVIYIMFKIDPAVLSSLVPEPLKPNPEGLAFAKLYQLKRRRPDSRYREPAFSQYNEIVLATAVEHD